MRQIDVDFEVWKLLTSKLEHERQTYNDVLRGLLGMDSIQEFAADPNSAVGAIADMAIRVSDAWNKPTGGFYSRGLCLPDGTKMRARYKGNTYYAHIEKGEWIDESGRKHGSPSSAATAITRTNVNGWRFWEAIRPNDTTWRRLDFIS